MTDRAVIQFPMGTVGRLQNCLKVEPYFYMQSILMLCRIASVLDFSMRLVQDLGSAQRAGLCSVLKAHLVFGR